VPAPHATCDCRGAYNGRRPAVALVGLEAQPGNNRSHLRPDVGRLAAAGMEDLRRERADGPVRHFIGAVISSAGISGGGGFGASLRGGGALAVSGAGGGGGL
jgi:hypothetical protein